MLDRNLAVIDQTAAAVRALAELYTEIPGPGRSAAGTHVRHVVDHYDAFLAGLESGRIDYYARARDRRTEFDPDTALAALARIRKAVAAAEQLLDRRILVDSEGPDGNSGSARGAPSTARRELAFVLSHTLHHLATIRVLGEELGVGLDRDLGVAHSTLSHRGRGAASSI